MARSCHSARLDRATLLEQNTTGGGVARSCHSARVDRATLLAVPGAVLCHFFWSLPKSCLKLSLVQTWIFGILEALLSLKERAKKGVQVLNGKG